MKDRFLSFLFFFLSAWFLLSFFQNAKNPEEKNQADLYISSKKEWTSGQLVELTVKNNTENDIILGENQNPPENFIFEKYFNGRWEELLINSNEKDYGKTILKAKEKKIFTFNKQNNDLFLEIGKYKVSLKKDDQVFSTEFQISSVGIFKSLWRILFFKPIFNVLIFLISILPGHNLALGILILTLLIKILLIIPSKKAILQQKRMQKVQKELEGVKRRFAGDQHKIAQETMQIWKKHNINPLGTFTPMLVQFPIMIALFFVVRDGLSPHNSIFLWDFLADFDLSLVSKNFFNFLDLDQKGVWYLALIVALLQFLSMKLTFLKNKKEVKNKVKKSKKKEVAKENQMQMVNQIMTYALPVMIGFFTFSMPAVMGFYWGISTIFSIGQQIILNKSN